MIPDKKGAKKGQEATAQSFDRGGFSEEQRDSGLDYAGPNLGRQKRLAIVGRTMKVSGRPGREFCVFRCMDQLELVARIGEFGWVTLGGWLGKHVLRGAKRSLMACKDLRRTDSTGLCNEARRNRVVFLLSTIIGSFVVARTARDRVGRASSVVFMTS